MAQVVTSDSTLDPALARATFVFVAHVRGFVATLPGHTDSVQHAVVVVDTAYKVPRSVGALGGDTVRVVLPGSVTVVAGRRYLFFANGLSADSSLVLSAIAARGLAPGLAASTAMLFAELKDADVRIADRRYWARFDSAGVVALGVVSAIGPLVRQRRGERLRFSEHAPNWSQAGIRVERLFKGGPVLRDSGFVVLFPRSFDIHYRHVPKLALGQTRLFTLQPISAVPAWLRAGIDLRRAFVVLDSLDSLEPGDTLRITRRR